MVLLCLFLSLSLVFLRFSFHIYSLRRVNLVFFSTHIFSTVKTRATSDGWSAVLLGRYWILIVYDDSDALDFYCDTVKTEREKKTSTHQKKHDNTNCQSTEFTDGSNGVCVCVCALFSSVVRQLPKNMEFDVTRTMLKHGNLFVVVIENGLLSGPNVCVDR